MESLFIEKLALRLAPGYVLLKMEEDHRSSAGFDMVRYGEDQVISRSRRCEVVAVNPANFFSHEVWEHQSDRDFGSVDQKRLSRLAQRSNYYDVPIEVVAGDVVIVRSIALGSESLRFGEFMLAKYDQLFAKETSDGLYPLNGGLLLEMDKDKQQVLDVPASEFGLDLSMGEVKKEGCLVRKYLLFKESVDNDISLLGKKVLLSKRSAVRIEHDDHTRYAESDHPLYFTHRRFVNGCYDI